MIKKYCKNKRQTIFQEIDIRVVHLIMNFKMLISGIWFGFVYLRNLNLFSTHLFLCLDILFVMTNKE